MAQPTIQNGDYNRYDEIFPVGSRIRCESEWQPGKWKYGRVKCHMMNSYNIAQWMLIEYEDGSEAEYDYRWLDVENFRNSLVRPASHEDGSREHVHAE